jgi:hypothetical protein
VGVHWKKFLPAWFRVLAATAATVEFARRVEAMIHRHCHGEETKTLVLARSVEMSMQQSPAREG